ncbi:orotidine 5'-phosphate decarboxylase [Candidatus Bathyarchaeota archaeon ex4484_135]|nr:MAG: orotidine 5'-phosphate decarboxylase [Candidatus Bathyarchaeota archaeon ex4484_135]
MGFRELIREARENKGSPIVLALDLRPDKPSKLMRKASWVLEETAPYICAVKLNFHLILPLGLSGIRPILDAAHGAGLACIADVKLGDIGSTNEVAASYFFEAGFDALTASPLSGWEGGLEPLFKLAREAGKGIIVLAYMSHPGASETFGLEIAGWKGKYQRLYELFVEKALNWNADGLVVGATRPDVIRAIRERVGPGMLIFAPGVGFQGGDARAALEAGADFLIVGRSIVLADEPGRVAKSLLEALK